MNASQRGNVTTITFDISTQPEQWLLLTSDWHFDSVRCERDLIDKHLRQAKERNALVFAFGDIFDAMQGRFDPRRSMVELRKEYRRDDYYDYVVKDLSDYLAPYADIIALLGDGNHEDAVLKAANTNLVDRLVYSLNSRTGSKIVHGGYGGYVRFMNQWGTTPQGSTIMRYFHGAGGASPSTKGAGDATKQAVYYSDADIVVNGHSHNGWYIPITQERISGKGRMYFALQHHIRTPGYKNDYADGSDGWDVKRGGQAKPVGAVWVRMTYTNHAMDIEVIPTFTAPRVCTPSGDYY